MDFVEKNSDIIPDAIVDIIDFLLGEEGIEQSTRTSVRKSKGTTITAMKKELNQFIEELKNTVCFESCNFELFASHLVTI